MPVEPSEPGVAAGRHRELLLDYLQAHMTLTWPGADGLRVGDVLGCSAEAVAAGEAPGWAGLCRRHPDLVTEFQAYLARRS